MRNAAVLQIKSGSSSLASPPFYNWIALCLVHFTHTIKAIMGRGFSRQRLRIKYLAISFQVYKIQASNRGLGKGSHQEKEIFTQLSLLVFV